MKKNNGNISFEEKKIDVWHGDMASGGWKTVTRSSQIGEVQNIDRGCCRKGRTFNSIYIMIYNGNYEAINHPLIRPKYFTTCISN